MIDGLNASIFISYYFFFPDGYMGLPLSHSTRVSMSKRDENDGLMEDGIPLRRLSQCGDRDLKQPMQQ